jgi:molecular chaperone GrpE
MAKKSKSFVENEEHKHQNTADSTEEHNNDSALSTENLLAKIKQLEEYNQKLLLTVSTLTNDHKREIRSSEDKIERANKDFALELTEVLDVFYIATESFDIASIGDHAHFQTFFTGIDMTKNSITTVLEKHGVKRIFPLGEMFDHNFHQAISMVQSDKEKNYILAVLKAGYTLHGKLLRPALVSVSSGA